jgi:hypothetical protein
MPWLYYILLLLTLLVGLGLNVFTLPGNWLMLAATALYAWLTHGRFVSWWTLGALLVLTATAELIDFVAAPAAARKAGGSRRGLVGAAAGGILGGVLGTFIPVPVAGTLIGICVGTFGGTLLAEMAGGTATGHSVRISFGALRGRIHGTLLKLAFGCIILLVALWTAFPWNSGTTTPTIPPPLKTPATK